MTYLLGQGADPTPGPDQGKLTSRDAYKLVAQMVRDPFELWLNSHADFGKKIAELAVKAAQNRTKSTQKVEKKSSGIATPPGKLTDCESDDISRNEVFPVEGDFRRLRQAGPRQGNPGVPAAARCQHLGDRTRPAVQEQRGARHFRWPSASTRTASTRSTRSMCPACATAASSSCPMPTSMARIQVLLFTLFLSTSWRWSSAATSTSPSPPLFRVDVEAKGHTRKVYCWTKPKRSKRCTSWRRRRAEHKITVSRFKGPGVTRTSSGKPPSAPDTRRLCPSRPPTATSSPDAPNLHPALAARAKPPGAGRGWKRMAAGRGGRLSGKETQTHRQGARANSAKAWLDYSFLCALFAPWRRNVYTLQPDAPQLATLSPTEIAELHVLRS